MPYAYRKSERIRTNNEFVAVMKKGKRLSVDGLSLFYGKNDGRNFRIGISVGKKLGNAVARNLLRRRIRAALTLALGAATAGIDLVFVARPALADADFERVQKAVRSALERSVLRRGPPEAAST